MIEGRPPFSLRVVPGEVAMVEVTDAVGRVFDVPPWRWKDLAEEAFGLDVTGALREKPVGRALYSPRARERAFALAALRSCDGMTFELRPARGLLQSGDSIGTMNRPAPGSLLCLRG